MNLVLLLQRIALEVDFNDSESYQGDSFLPFLGFMCFLIGLVVTFVGIVKITNSRHQWNLFYDHRDKKDFTEPSVRKDGKIGIVMTIIGAIMMVVSFFIF